MAAIPSPASVIRPRFGRPEPTGIREHFAREVLASDTRVEAPYIAARMGVQTCHRFVPHRVPDRALRVIMRPSGGLRVAGRQELQRQ